MQKDLPRVLCHFSCGAASAVSTKLAIQKYGKERVTIINIHIKEEHPDNKRFLKDCEEWFGMPITTVQNEKYGGSIYEVFKQGYLKGIYGAPCTTQLKRKVRESFQRDDDIHVFGFTVEEEQRAIDFNDRNEALATEWNLIEQGITKPDCLGILQGAGIDIPVMYTLGYKNNNPCSLDTKISTTKGVYEIGELLNTRVKMFGRGGVVDADINYMGDQEVIELSISRKGMPSKSLKFTPDHKWYNVSRRGKRFDGDTLDLKVGDFLPVIDFGGVSFKIDTNYALWGFCIGDGSLNGDYSAIRAFGEKWLALESIGVRFSSHNKEIDMKCLGMLPKHYKTHFIEESEDMTAKMSFLAGLFLADGSCNIKGQTCLSTTEYVEELRGLLSSCGLPTTSLVQVKNAGNKNAKGVVFKRNKACISVNFRAPKSIMLKQSHIDNFVGGKRSLRGWRIDSIKSAGIEPVACATVIDGLPEFALEDMILTGNCVGCVKGGMGYWNQIRKDFPDVFARMSMTERDIGHAILKDKDGAVWLDELDPKRGRMTEEEDIECSLVCTGTLNSF